MENNVNWKKSRSSQASSDCVEVHRTLVQVRDSKNSEGPALRVDVTALITAIRHGWPHS
jgi:hypothetical protein